MRSLATRGLTTFICLFLMTGIAAAQSVLKSHDENALPVIEGALAKETNKSVKAAFAEARRSPDTLLTPPMRFL